MTSAYLQSLGFIPTTHPGRNGHLAFAHAWRHRYNHLAADGTPLFLEHLLGIEACRLSATEASLIALDVFASIGLHDRPALAEAMTAFYKAHGGMGRPLPAVAEGTFRPFRRQS